MNLLDETTMELLFFERIYFGLVANRCKLCIIFPPHLFILCKERVHCKHTTAYSGAQSRGSMMGFRR